MKINDYYRVNFHERFTPEGLALYQRIDSLFEERRQFTINYYAEHPMLWALYDAKDAIHKIVNYERDGLGQYRYQYEPLMNLYQNQLCDSYVGHPIHEEISYLLVAVYLQPGKPYIDYDVHTTDGQTVRISSLIKGKVALIDLWASWCGGCRKHSKAMILVYEKYKDQGFTVVAIARERTLSAMEKAMKRDGYPWPSLIEPMNDENHVWSKNGAARGGGAMILVDRDGTILSTSTEASELEPLIRKALGLN